jgi:hypothetical protein
MFVVHGCVMTPPRKCQKVAKKKIPLSSIRSAAGSFIDKIKIKFECVYSILPPA